MSDIDFKDFIKLYKDYAKEPYSFLVNDTTLSSDNPLRFTKTLLKNEWEIKAINNKIEQNKAQNSLDREAAKISALSSGNVSDFEFLTVKDKKDLLEKITAALKRFEYSPLDKAFEKQTNVVKNKLRLLIGRITKWNERLDTISGADKKISLSGGKCFTLFV